MSKLATQPIGILLKKTKQCINYSKHKILVSANGLETSLKMGNIIF